MLGELIHNAFVTEQLEKKGLSVISSPVQAQNGQTVIIRAHGVGREVYEQLEAAGAEVCDATCPFVRKIHNIVLKNSAEDTPVLIAGDPNHPEVIGIRGYCRGQAFVFSNSDELEKILTENAELCKIRIIVVSQTTFSQNEWKNCKEKIKIYCTNAKIFDTICLATEKRQTEAAALSEKCDMMIIIGGRHSSNTAKLKAVCSENCETHLVERAEELKTINFSHCAEIGVNPLRNN